MKRMGWAVACAAMLAVGCAGDDRDYRADDANGSAVGTTADGELFGSSENEFGMPGSVGTSGQAGQGHGPDSAKDFTHKAAMHGHAEVELGRLAVERAESEEVKQFAQMMVRDHTKANNELKQAVSGQNVEMPATMDQKHQQLMTRLRTLRGAEFDREYMRAMVEGHKEATHMLETRAHGQPSARTAQGSAGQAARSDQPRTEQRGRDERSGATGTSGVATGGSQLENAVNEWATKTLPTVEQHLQRAEQIHGKLEGSNTGTAGAQRGDTNRR